MFPHLRSLSYENRLRQLGLWSLEERRNRADLIELFKMIKALSSTPWSQFLKKAEHTTTRGRTWKLTKKHGRCDTRLYFFSQRVINRWNNLSQEDVDAQSINFSRVDSRKDVHGRWTSLKTYSLQVVSAARNVNQEDVHQDETSMPGAAAPGKYNSLVSR